MSAVMEIRQKVEVYQDAKMEWRWRAVAENGRIVADGSEGYKNFGDAVHGMQVAAKIMRETLEVAS